MLYDLSRETDKSRLRTRLAGLEVAGAVVELTEKRQRTPSQNNYLHLLLGWYALETGNTLEYVKGQYFKRLCNPSLFVRRREDRWLGEVEELRSTRELSAEELSLAIDRFRDWSASECGIYLPEAHESEFLREVELEISRNGRWL